VKPLPAVLLVVALLALTSGCVTKKVKRVLQKDTEASLTVSGEAELLLTVQKELSVLHKVGVNVETIETGVRIIKIVGAYKAVVDAIAWLIQQHLQLLGNDEVSRALLEAAFAALK
jgi:hypothetical protein